MKTLTPIYFLLIVILGCSNQPKTNTANVTSDPNSSNKSTVDALTIKATDLVRAYRENEIAADEKYRGKLLAVTGKIGNINETLGTLQVDLDGVNFVVVKCIFDEGKRSEIAKIKKGQTTTLIGTGEGMTAGLYVGLANCQIK